MPQDSIFPTTPRVTGYRLTIRSNPVEEGWADNVMIELEHDNAGWATTYAQRWSGLMLDLYGTLASETMNAYLYDTAKAVRVAAVGVAKVARAHARRHDR